MVPRQPYSYVKYEFHYTGYVMFNAKGFANRCKQPESERNKGKQLNCSTSQSSVVYLVFSHLFGGNPQKLNVLSAISARFLSFTVGTGVTLTKHMGME